MGAAGGASGLQQKWTLMEACEACNQSDGRPMWGACLGPLETSTLRGRPLSDNLA